MYTPGVMNGVDAAAVALGQDFRAIEAGAHAWASRNGTYRPLTSYRIVKDANGVLCLEVHSHAYILNFIPAHCCVLVST